MALLLPAFYYALHFTGFCTLHSLVLHTLPVLFLPPPYDFCLCLHVLTARYTCFYLVVFSAVPVPLTSTRTESLGSTFFYPHAATPHLTTNTPLLLDYCHCLFLCHTLPAMPHSGTSSAFYSLISLILSISPLVIYTASGNLGVGGVAALPCASHSLLFP